MIYFLNNGQRGGAWHMKYIWAAVEVSWTSWVWWTEISHTLHSHNLLSRAETTQRHRMALHRFSRKKNVLTRSFAETGEAACSDVVFMLSCCLHSSSTRQLSLSSVMDYFTHKSCHVLDSSAGPLDEDECWSLLEGSWTTSGFWAGEQSEVQKKERKEKCVGDLNTAL